MSKKIIMFFSIIVIMVVSIILLEFKFSENRRISRDIEINIPLSCDIYYKDTHNGFNMDGEFYSEVYFDSRQAKSFVEAVKENKNWKELPMSLELQEEITEDKFGDGIEVPIIENGYWFFLDRHSQTVDKYNEPEIHNRYSSNYTVAIFDTNKNILYYYELDT